MNILIFLFQVTVIVVALYGACRLGREALVMLCAMMSVLANFFVLQQIGLLGWNATSSDAFAVGTLFGLNLLQQTYGKETAKKALWISFFAMLFFVLVSQVHLLYTPSEADTSRAHFKAILSTTPRLLVASVITFFIVQWLDLRMYGVALKRWETVSWRLRSAGCLVLSQAFDTALFSYLGLYGIVTELGSIMAVSYAIKCAAILFTSVGACFFNPFKKLSHEV